MSCVQELATNTLDSIYQLFVYSIHLAICLDDHLFVISSPSVCPVCICVLPFIMFAIAMGDIISINLHIFICNLCRACYRLGIEKMQVTVVSYYVNTFGVPYCNWNTDSNKSVDFLLHLSFVYRYVTHCVFCFLYFTVKIYTIKYCLN